MNHGLSSAIAMIRSGRPRLMSLLNTLKHKIDTAKGLISIFWSIKGIYSFLDVPKGTTYNIAFFIDVFMPNLIENVRSRTRKKTLKIWLIDTDSARPHNSQRAQRCSTPKSRTPVTSGLQPRSGPECLLPLWID
jgi:hypothetical protein